MAEGRGISKAVEAFYAIFVKFIRSHLKSARMSLRLRLRWEASAFAQKPRPDKSARQVGLAGNS